jgi:hypothetical protein
MGSSPSLPAEGGGCVGQTHRSCRRPIAIALAAARREPARVHLQLQVILRQRSQIVLYIITLENSERKVI